MRVHSKRSGSTCCGLEVERAGAQLVFWLKLGELSQLGSAQLTILNLLASSARDGSRQEFLKTRQFKTETKS